MKRRKKEKTFYFLIVSFTYELIIHAVYKIMLQIYETAGNAFLNVLTRMILNSPVEALAEGYGLQEVHSIRQRV